MEDTGWSRVSPFSIIYYFTTNLINILRSAIYALPALAFNLESVKANYHYWLLGIAATASLVLIYSVLSYFRFFYRLTESGIQIRSGVMHKNSLDLPFDRVQSVNIVQPLIFRLFNYAVLTFDSAGSAQEEASLASLPLEQAQQLKTEVMQKRHAQDVEQMQSEKEQDTLLCKRNLIDLVIHGITSNRVWIILGASAPVWDDGINFIQEQLEDANIDVSSLIGQYAEVWWQIGLLVLGVAILFLFFIATLSIAGAIIMFYRYTLVKRGHNYVRRSGLFTLREVSLNHSRLQVIKFSQSWLDLFFGRCNLHYIGNTSGIVVGESFANSNHLLVPSVTDKQAIELMKEALPNSAVGAVQFSPISKAFIANRLLFIGLPLAAIAIAVAIAKLNAISIGLLVFTLALVPALIVLRWYRWGYAEDEQYMYVQSGLFGKTLEVFAKFKVQQVSLKATWLMQRSHRINLQTVLASGAVYVPFLPELKGRQLAEDLIDNALQSERSWM